MRYSPDYKAAARAKLVETAAALAKEKGFGTTGVDALMAAAGLTSGAFYSHFKTKPDLLRAIIEHELGRTGQLFAGRDAGALRQMLQLYLSEQHVNHPALGCPLPSLTAEVGRADEATRQVFEQRLVQVKEQIEDHLPGTESAWPMLAQAVGAVMLARAMASDEVRRELLDAVRKNLDPLPSVTGQETTR